VSKINAFTLKDPDTCVRCGMDMPEGTVVSWLRMPTAKGYFHTGCVDKPIIESLLKVKVQAADSPLGYIWMRTCTIPEGTPLGETTPATRLIPSHNPDPTHEQVADLIQQIAEAVAQNQPRIVLNVYVAKAGEEVKALDLLSKELFLLNSVQKL
jgi:hypothetical protein